MEEFGRTLEGFGDEPSPSSSPTTTEYLESLGPEERQVAEILENVRRKLLDITGNNRFLSFRETSKSLRFVRGKIDRLYHALVEDGDSIEIVSAQQEDLLGGAEDLWDAPPGDSVLLADSAPDTLEKKLRRIASDGRAAIEETGLNLMFLAFGFLEWTETEEGRKFSAPLVLVPVSLTKLGFSEDTGYYQFAISYDGEDIERNTCLAEKMLQFGFDLPPMEAFNDEENGGFSPSDYVSDVNATVSAREGWGANEDVILGFFQFSKLRMYEDLKPERWGSGTESILEHELVKDSLLGRANDGGPQLAPEDYDIDRGEEAKAVPLVLDADSSQHSALIDALSGKTMVIHGPPGTGKSQTITNLIAGAMACGKRVLFISEKMAALEVVHRNLSRLDLHHFCLELHSKRANKKEVLNSVKQRLALHLPPSYDIDSKLARFEELKEGLHQYTDALAEIVPPINETVYSILGKSTNYRSELESFPRIPVAGMEEMDGADLSQRCRALVDIAEHVSTYGHLYRGTWKGFVPRAVSVDLRERTKEAFITLSTALSDATPAMQELGCESISPGDSHVRSLPAVCQMAKTAVQDRPTESSALWMDLSGKTTRRDLHEFLIHLDTHQAAVETIRRIQDSLCWHPVLDRVSRLADNAGQLLPMLSASTSLASLKDLAQAMHAFYDSCIECIQLQTTLQPLHGIIGTATPANLMDCAAFLAHMESCPSFLRHSQTQVNTRAHMAPFANALEQWTEELTAERRSLEKDFVLTPPPALSDVVAIRERLEHGTSSSVEAPVSSLREARKNLRRLTKTRSMSRRDNEVPQLRRLEGYLLELARLRHNRLAVELYGTLFDGVDTAWGAIQGTDTWVRDLLEFVDGESSIAELAVASEKVQATPDAVKSLSQIEALREAGERLESALAACGACGNLGEIAPKRSGTDLEGLCKTIEPLLATIDETCRDADAMSASSGLLISQWIEIVEAMTKARDAGIAIEGSATAREILGDNYATVKTDRSALSATLRWADQVCTSVLPSDVKTCILSCLSVDEHARIAGLLQTIDESCGVAIKTYDEVVLSLADVNEKEFFGSGFDQCTADTVVTKAAQCREQISQLSAWVAYLSLHEVAKELGLRELVTTAEEGTIDFQNLELTFKAIFYTTLAELVMETTPVLLRFSGVRYGGLRKEFAKLDRKIMKMQRQAVARQIDERHHSPAGNSRGLVSSYTELGLIRRELAKRRRHIPVRSLVARAGKALQGLKPCFMMSPMSVAQFIAPNSLEFDLIVMDEASQLKPEDALGALARGKQAVVVGDQKQLPPTSFFERFGGEVDSADENPLRDMESILDVFVGNYPGRMLKWHYRSQHHSLISFSNRRYYDDELLVFPTPDMEASKYGIRLHYVEDGQFGGGGKANMREAQRVAGAIVKHVQEHRDLSIGVVAMSLRQQYLIEDCLDALLRDDRQAERALNRFNKLHEEKADGGPLFIKNLESVQGDERDVIFISCTYGPDPESNQVFQRFGPINNRGGERRLNVLFTRSRMRMEIFTSMRSSDITAGPGGSQGARDLRAFLVFAETGKLLDEGHLSGRPPDSDFEIAVGREVAKLGYEVDYQFGVAGFFLDLAVRKPGSGHILGIECDGATYHSSRSARDRDRIREEIIVSRGWRIHRIWSTDWFHRKEQELQRLRDALTHAAR